MAIYSYDGSFEGLLCAFQVAADARDDDAAFESENSGASGWLLDSIAIETRPEAAFAFCSVIEKAGGKETLNHITAAFLSEAPGFEDPLFAFIRLTLEKKRCIIGWHGQETVSKVNRLVRKVGHETHRFLGLLRFMMLRDGLLYAPFEPDHNILIPVARHFQSRLRNEHWVIHDRKRDLALAWDGSQMIPVLETPPNIDALLADEEKTYQELWWLFTNRVAIHERTNPKLQRQCMPSRYWRYLPEMTVLPRAASGRI